MPSSHIARTHKDTQAPRTIHTTSSTSSTAPPEESVARVSLLRKGPPPIPVVRQTRRQTQASLSGVTGPANTRRPTTKEHHRWHCSWTPTPSKAESRRPTSRRPTRPTSRRRAPYGVDYLRYWVDEEAGKIFCLVEAPDAETAHTVHREAHGLVADEIYSVSEHS